MASVNQGEQSEPREGFIQLKRGLVHNFESKDLPISFDAFGLFVFLSLKANPYNSSISTNYTVLSESTSDTRWTKNKVNKVMLELKAAGLVDYPDQQGKRGLFPIKISRQYLFGGKPIQEKAPIHIPSQAQKPTNAPPHRAEVDGSSQKFKDLRSDLYKRFSSPQQLGAGRSANNDTDKEKDKYIFEGKNPPGSTKATQNRGKILTASYEPSSREEARCQEIARDLDEPYMDFILSRLKRPGGFSAIETAYGRFKEDKASGKPIIKPGAYFNTILENLFTERNKSVSIDSGTQQNSEGT